MSWVRYISHYTTRDILSLSMRYLSLMLLAPWLMVLAWAYWTFPRMGAGRVAKRIFDVFAIGVAGSASVWCALLAFDSVAIKSIGALGPESGSIWKQVVPALYGYGAFVAVLIVAVLVRYLIWQRSKPRSSPAH